MNVNVVNGNVNVVNVNVNVLQVRGVMEKYPPYQAIFSKLSYGESQMLDKAFYEEEVKRLCLAFEQQVSSTTPVRLATASLFSVF